MSKRVEVKVVVEFDLDGQIVPISIIWPDGRVFSVDRLLDVRMAPAKSGGSGMRFLCRIMGKEVPLYNGPDATGKRSTWWCDGK